MSELVVLDDDGLFRADLAFLDAIKMGGTQAEAVQAAIRAYLSDALIIRRDENGNLPLPMIESTAWLLREYAEVPWESAMKCRTRETRE